MARILAFYICSATLCISAVAADIASEYESAVVADWRLQSCGDAQKDCDDQIERTKRIISSRGLSEEIRKKYLAELEKVINLPASEEKYLALRKIKRAAIFASPEIDFSEVICTDSPYPVGPEAPHESRFRTENTASYGAKLLRLNIFGKGESVLAPKSGEAAIWRSDIDFSAKTIVFSMREKGGSNYNLYTVDVDGGNLRRLTASKYNDVDPAWLPDGGIVFCTSRANCYIRCGGSAFRSTILARCNADGKDIYFISTNNEADYMPSVLADGRVLYCRWEYVDKNIFRVQSLWTVNPDGTNPQVFWGGQSHYPDLKIGAVQIPGTEKFLFQTSSHHNVFYSGLGVIIPTEGTNYPNGLYNLTPYVGWAEAGFGPKETDKLYNEKFFLPPVYTSFYSPYPLGKNFYLVSAKRGKMSMWRILDESEHFSLYIADYDGNMELIANGKNNILHAQPVRARRVLRVIPSSVKPVGDLTAQNNSAKAGVLYSANIYDNSGIPFGEGKRLRVIEHCAATYQDGNRDSMKEAAAIFKAAGVSVEGSLGVYDILSKDVKPRRFGFLSGETSMSLILDESHKRILGEVPIEDDGSVNVEIPAMKAVYFQVLDKDGKVLQTMRSSTHVMSGEQRGCLGCHATKISAAPQFRPSKALRKPPQKLEKPFSDITFGFGRYIQPILDKHCIECHNPAATDTKLDLTSRKILPQKPFTASYVNLVFGVGKSGGIAGAISPYFVYPSLEADIPCSESVIAPMTVLTYASPLIKRLEGGHGGKLSKREMDMLKAWIDLNCPFFGEEDVLEMPDVSKSDYEARRPDFRDLSYLPKMRTAPDVDRAFRQDKYNSQDDRCPRDCQGNVLPSVIYENGVRRTVLP